MAKRNLVIVRAGDKSLHVDWLRPVGAPRNWDLVVSYFGNDPDIYRRPDVVRIDHKGPKWMGLHALLTSGQLDWRAYDNIWMPDDDLACTPEVIDRLFMLFDYHELQLAQPSLSPDSYVSHGSTVHNPAFLLRRTNFIEVMAPMLTRELLERVLPTMIENESGWGLDFLWQTFLDRPRRDSAVIDAVQIRHTRPVGGPNYERMVAQGKSPHDDLLRLRRKYAIQDVAQVCWGAVTVDGREVSIDEETEAMPLLQAVLDGMRPWLKEVEIAYIIGGHLRQCPTVRRVAEGLRQPVAA
jgi:hypothetical protein